MLSTGLGYADVTNRGVMGGLHLTGISATLENSGLINSTVRVDANASQSASGGYAAWVPGLARRDGAMTIAIPDHPMTTDL